MNKVSRNFDTANEQVKNSYLAHIEQASWNDIQAYHLTKEITWKILAIISVISLLIVSIVSIILINQNKHKVLVFEKDNLGNLSTLGIATKTLSIDNKILAHQLANFIIAIREVPKELSIKKRNISLVHSMVAMANIEYFDKLIINQYHSASGRGVVVTINRIKPIIKDKSWEVNWQEKIDNDRGINDIKYFSANIVFSLATEVLYPEIQLLNPTGILISYFNPVADINQHLE